MKELQGVGQTFGKVKYLYMVRQMRRTICYNGYGTNKSGNHTENRFRKTMRKHHIYDCIKKYCNKTKDKQICALSRKCERRNKRKQKFTAKKWVKWSGAYYGKCAKRATLNLYRCKKE